MNEELSKWFQESMIAIYGRKPWESSGFASAADIWAAALDKRGLLTKEILTKAMGYCVDHIPTIPTLPQFVEICRGQTQRIKPFPKTETPEPLDTDGESYKKFQAAIAPLLKQTRK